MQRKMNEADKYLITGRRNGQVVAVDSTSDDKTAKRIAESWRDALEVTVEELACFEPSEKRPSATAKAWAIPAQF